MDPKPIVRIAYLEGEDTKLLSASDSFIRAWNLDRGNDIGCHQMARLLDSIEAKHKSIEDMNVYKIGGLKTCEILERNGPWMSVYSLNLDMINTDLNVDVVAMQQEEMDQKRLEAQKRAEQRAKGHISTPMHYDKRYSNPVIQPENNFSCVGTTINTSKSHLQRAG